MAMYVREDEGGEKTWCVTFDDPFLLAIKSGKLDLTKDSDFYKGLVDIKRLLGG